MKLQLIAVGNKMPSWVSVATQDYLNRFPKDMPIELIEVPAEKRGKQANILQVLTLEGQTMLSHVGKGNRIVTLDIPGKQWDTVELAQQIERWKLDGRNISFLIGGPEGLSDACKRAADHSWSLSRLTLPHPLARVIVAESLYRAWSIIAHHPYHRE